MIIHKNPCIKFKMSMVTTTQLFFIELNPLLVLLTSVIDEKNKTKIYSEIYSLC